MVSGEEAPGGAALQDVVTTAGRDEPDQLGHVSATATRDNGTSLSGSQAIVVFGVLASSLRGGNRECKECAIACAKARQDGKRAWPCQEEGKTGRDAAGRGETWVMRGEGAASSEWPVVSSRWSMASTVLGILALATVW